MEVYWKVHKHDFYNFILFIRAKYKYFINDNSEARKFNRFTDYFKKNDYLYLIVNKCSQNYPEKYYELTYIPCDSDGEKWLNDNNLLYKGEFLLRKKKLEHLNKISKIYE